MEVISFTMALLILLFQAYDDLGGQTSYLADVENKFDNDMNDIFVEDDRVPDMATVTMSTLYTYRLCHLFCFSMMT